jgi:hypothetical protein
LFHGLYFETAGKGDGTMKDLISYIAQALVDHPEQISDHQQSWGYEDGPWKGPGPPLLVAADF